MFSSHFYLYMPNYSIFNIIVKSYMIRDIFYMKYYHSTILFIIENKSLNDIELFLCFGYLKFIYHFSS